MTEDKRADPLLTIGIFARRSRLSMKALRVYERLGILVPAQVDPANGYRRYRESQLATARLIVLLRRIDMPLARVAEVIAAIGPQGAEAAMRFRATLTRAEIAEIAATVGTRGSELIATYWNEVESRVASQRQLAAHLRNRLLGEEGVSSMFEIRQREVPEQLVLTEQRHIRVDELSNWIGEATMRLMKSAETLGGVTAPMFVAYHGEVNQESDGPVEVCLPIALAQEGKSDVAMRHEPAHREAYTRITKAQVAFPQILSAYDAVGQWITTNGLNMSGSPREVYFADFMAAAPTDEVCDIAFPI